MEERSGPSPAKINLTLRVVGQRSDGFHEIESLVVLVDFCDTVTVRRRADRRLSVECDDPTIPGDERNLALRAARSLHASTGSQHGAHIRLRKVIPAGSGLGGGSSNAATTLRLLNDLWGTGHSSAELACLAAGVGSDAPLFFSGPLCIVRGRGEQVERVAAAVAGYAALVLPALHCATSAVYAAWDRLTGRPRRPGLAEVLGGLKSADAPMSVLFNDLEAAAFGVEPRLGELAEAITALTGLRPCMTGSGAGLFRLFGREQAATAFAGEVGRRLNVRTAVVRLLTAEA